MSQNTHTFSIEHKEDPTGKRPFGSAFAGNFVVRRPTIADKQRAALAEASALSLYGIASADLIDTSAKNIIYIFSLVDAIAEEKPEWFDQNKLYDGEENAIYAVWQEVSQWLKKFRSGDNR